MPKAGSRRTSIHKYAERYQKKAIDDSEGVSLEPPDHVPLTPTERMFFDEIMEEFEHKIWTRHQVTLVALLARELYMMEKQQRLFRREGALAEGDKGGLKVNPRRSVINMCASSVLAMRRSLTFPQKSMMNYRVPIQYGSDKRVEARLNGEVNEVYADEENEELIPRLE